MTWGAFKHLGSAARELRHSIMTASDAQVLRILGLVEAMTERGQADELISPLRDRLNVLKPPRRLRFRRLLFYPLGPLIVPPRNWRPNLPGLPRSIVAPVARHVRAAIPDVAAWIDAEIDERTTADRDLIARVGAVLWPAAAKVLLTTAVPADWTETALARGYFLMLAPVLASLLLCAPDLERICLTSVEGVLPPQPEPIQAIIRQTTESHAAALPMLITLLLLRLPDASSVFARSGRGKDPASVWNAMDQSVDWLLTRLAAEGPETWIAGGSLADAAIAVRRLAALLRQIEDLPGHLPRKDQCQALRARLAAACRNRFEKGLRGDLLVRLADKNQAPEPGCLEALSRGLRSLEHEARGLGGAKHYDRMLAETSDVIRLPAGAQLTLVARMRLVEILEGSAAALAMKRMDQ